jgi:hypothetical protein
MDGNLINEAETPDTEARPDESQASEPTPKKRGRKPMPRDADGNVIRPPRQDRESVSSADETVIDASVPAPKKRGRPTTKKSVDAAALAYQLVGIHQLIAKLPGMAAFEIGDEEAKILAPAMADFSREYGVSVSPKAAATVQLLGALAMVYGPRVAHTMASARAAKKQARVASSHGHMAESVPASVSELRPGASHGG